MVSPSTRFWVSTLLLLLFVETVVSGLFLLMLPHGEAAILGANKHTWEAIHTYSGILFALLALVHFAINAPMYTAEARAALR